MYRREMEWGVATAAGSRLSGVLARGDDDVAPARTELQDGSAAVYRARKRALPHAASLDRDRQPGGVHIAAAGRRVELESHPLADGRPDLPARCRQQAVTLQRAREHRLDVAAACVGADRVLHRVDLYVAARGPQVGRAGNPPRRDVSARGRQLHGPGSLGQPDVSTRSRGIDVGVDLPELDFPARGAGPHGPVKVADENVAAGRLEVHRGAAWNGHDKIDLDRRPAAKMETDAVLVGGRG